MVLSKKRIQELAASGAPGDRKKIGSLEAWVSIAVNLIIAAIKFIFGFLSSSVSLLADAMHTLSDVLSSGIVLMGFRISAQPPDRSHPFGHGRMELISAVIMATLLFAVGVEFLKDGVWRLISPEFTTLSTWGFAAVAVTLLMKEGLARFAIWLGNLIQSKALIADGHHHRSDALSTIVVLLALAGVKLGYPWLDGAGGIVVAGFIMHTAYELIRDSVSPLLGQRPDKSMLRHINEIAESEEGVIGTHDIVVHDFQTIYNISAHIEVDHRMTLTEAHEISDRIEQRVEAAYPGWTVIHVDPVNRDHPAYPEVTETLQRLTVDYPFLDTAHDLRLVGTADRFNIVFDVNVSLDDAHQEMLRQIKRILGDQFNTGGVVITVDPPV